MDVIEVNRNCVTTECGHCFHASCLIQSVAHNGFGCPYCRTIMAEVPEEESSDDGDNDEEATVFDEDALTSFRMFHQRLNGEEVEEEAEDWETDGDENDEEEEEEAEEMPDATYVAQKLASRGITFEDLVKNILFQEHSNFGDFYNDYERRSSEVYGQFRAVITQYTPAEPSITEVEVTEPPAVKEAFATQHIMADFGAQSKPIKVSFIRELNCC